MSGFTLDGITRAIQAHIDDEALVNETVVSYVVAIHTAAFEADDPEVHSYWFECPENQPSHVTRGLVSLAREWAMGSPLHRED